MHRDKQHPSRLSLATALFLTVNSQSWSLPASQGAIQFVSDTHENTPSMTDAQVPTEIDLQVGDQRDIALTSHSTAGYSWDLQVTGPSSVVTLELRREPLPDTLPLKVGQSAPEFLHINALAPGVVTVLLDQRRRWERDRPPIQSLQIKLTVR